jgi:tetrahydromethanopterin S-methyltransferase subunit G
MRYVHFAVAILLLIVGFASAQSNVPSTPDQSPSQPATQAAAQQDVLARLDALERRLEQLEKRVDAALPPGGAAPGTGAVAAGGTTPGNALVSASRLEELDQKVRDIVEEAVTFAERSPEPEPRELYTDVYAR